MRKNNFLLMVLLLLFVLTSASFAQVNTKSRNGQDSVEITKITPRSLSSLLKPVNMPINLEVLYDLKTAGKGKVVICFYKVYRKGISKNLDIVEIKEMRKVFTISKGKANISYISIPLKIAKDEKIYTVYTVASLLDSKNKEQAFSTSKNMVAGTFEIIPGKGAPERDAIQEIGIKPRTGSSITAGQTTDFQISMKYSLKTKEMAYVVVTFSDISEMGTGLCWHSSTFTVPRGQGKLVIKPTVYFAKNLSGKNMGVGISLWLDPLKNSLALLRFVDYFLK